MPKRVLVIVDSDCHEATGEPSAAARTVKRECEVLDIGVVVWSKRAIENYVGDVELTKYLNVRRDRLHELPIIKGMSREQRDRCQMKNLVGDFVYDLLEVVPEFDRESLDKRDADGDLRSALEELERIL